nr:hypothetical protein [Tanacetum cinerariifolium]
MVPHMVSTEEKKVDRYIWGLVPEGNDSGRKRHEGQQRNRGNCPKCDKCKQMGHLARNCQRDAGNCLKCDKYKQIGHLAPNNNNNAGNQRAPTQGIDNDIYSTVDAFPNACEMCKAIERLKQGESIIVQDLETNLYWIFGKFTSWDGESLESYYSRFYKMMNELVRNQCDVTNHQVNVQFLLQLQPKWQSANQDNSPRINRGIGYDNKRIVNVAGARETVEQVDWKDDTDDEPEDQELEAHYMYMAQIQDVTPDAADNYGPIFDSEPLKKVDQDDNDDDLANERELLASFIKKLKYEIDDNKNRNKFLETSNKALVDKLKDLKKFQAELDRYNDVKYAWNVEVDCAKAKGDLMSYKMEYEKSFNAYT